MTFPQPRPDLAGLTPYRTSDTQSGRIFLHANESPFGPPPAVVEDLLARVRDLALNRYPPDADDELISAIASYAGVRPETVTVGSGSNEVLLQACLAYGGPGRTALLFEPTYRMHHRQARIAGTDVVSVPRRPDFTLDLPSARTAIADLQPHIVFVCSPDNPTGAWTSPEVVRTLATDCAGLVIVDEAYFEFAPGSVIADLAEHPNLLVVRTLSKAFRLAGARLGYGVAHPQVLEAFDKVRMPYSVSALARAAALAVLGHAAEILGVVEKTIAERRRLANGLRATGAEVFPSEANFVFFRRPGAATQLAETGIVVRDFDGLAGCEGCARVTVGLPEENDAFLHAMAQLT